MDTERLLSDAYLAHHPAEAARVIEGRPVAEVAAFLCECGPHRLAPVVALMDPAVSAAVLDTVDHGLAARLVAALDAHTASGLLRRLAPTVRGAVLDRLSARAGAPIRTLLRYPPGSAGALLDPAVLTVPPDLSVGDTLKRVRTAAAQVHDYVFVVDRRGLLVGVVSLRELLVASPEVVLGAAARRAVGTLAATADRDAILAHPSWNDLHALPVVDAGGRFLGIVRHETLRRLETEAPATPVGTAAADAALEFGEMAWTGGAALLEELLAVVSPAARRTVRGRTGE